MIFDLPCKLGEKFTTLKFVDWVGEERIYKEDIEVILTGFEKSLFDIVCHGKIRGRNAFFSYGDYGKHYYPCYRIMISDTYFESHELSAWGFPTTRRGKLHSVMWEDGFVVVDFCVEPRCEHIRYAIKEIVYEGEIQIEFDEEAEARRTAKRNEPEREEKNTHSEELLLNDDDKNALIKFTLESAKSIGLKLRKSDIDKTEMKAQFDIFGNKIYTCVVYIGKLGDRKKKIPKKIKSDNIYVQNEKMLFIYRKKC